MFFLLVEFAKEEGNEVLSHLMGDLGTSQDVSFMVGHVTKFFFSCQTLRQFSQPPTP